MTATTTKRKAVEKRFVKRVAFGPCYLIRITYEDDRVSYGVSTPGMLALFGDDPAAAQRLADSIKEVAGHDCH